MGEPKYNYLAAIDRDCHPSLRKEYEQKYEQHYQQQYEQHYQQYEQHYQRQCDHLPECNLFEDTCHEMRISDQAILKQNSDTNHYLRLQLDQMEAINTKLKRELAICEEQMKLMNAHYRQAQQTSMTGIVAEVETLLKNNAMLENQNIKLKACIARQAASMRTRKAGALQSRSLRHSPRKITQTLSHLDKEISFDSHPKCRQSSKIETQNGEILIQQQKSEVGRSKNQGFIESVKCMYSKMNSKEAGSLKQVWKWLKAIAHQHYSLKRCWKKVQQTGAKLSSTDLHARFQQICSQII